jgi:hypothetical protein
MRAAPEQVFKRAVGCGASHCDAGRQSGKLRAARLRRNGSAMNLLLRINLALGTAWVAAALLPVYVCSRLLETNARQKPLGCRARM